MIVAPSMAAVMFWRKIRQLTITRAVWSGMVGVTPMKTPRAMARAISSGFPFRLRNRL